MDDLTRIKGIGPATAKRLVKAGIDGFAALAVFEPEDPRFMSLGIGRVDLIGMMAAAKVMAADAEAMRLQDHHEVGGKPVAMAIAAVPERLPIAGDLLAPGLRQWPTADTLMPPKWPLDAEAGDFRGLGDMTAIEFARAFPLTVAAIREWSEQLGDAEAPTVRIRAKRDGFRRCNMAHPKAATDHPGERFTPDELERLLSEPNLVVELV